MKNYESLLSVRDAAKALGLSVACIRAWISKRRISVVRLGRAVRIDPAEVQRLIAAGTTPAREVHRV